MGPPMSPPETMPTIAEATASVAADGTPASSNSGANANPVAGPPVSVTDPASTPSSGGWPSSVATPRPSTFCAMAASVEATKKISTSGPPMRSSARLAPKPTEAKNAFCSGVCSVASKVTGAYPRWWATLRSEATSRPPTTGAGMLYRLRSGTRRLMP